MENHIKVLTQQNHDLTCELDRFVHTDELLRQQLDRRCRVQEMNRRQTDEVRHSNYRVQEARSRSPCKSRSPTRK